MAGNRRLLLWVIGLLVTLNLISLAVMWLHPWAGSSAVSASARPDEQAIGRFLQSELALSDEQVHQFRQLRQRHAEQIRRLRQEINDLKQEQLSRQLLEAAPDTARAQEAARAIAQRQFELELLTFHHFAELQTLCGREQVDKLRSLLLELFMGPGRRSPEGNAPPTQVQVPTPGGVPPAPGGPVSPTASGGLVVSPDDRQAPSAQDGGAPPVQQGQVPPPRDGKPSPPQDGQPPPPREGQEPPPPSDGQKPARDGQAPPPPREGQAPPPPRDGQAPPPRNAEAR